MSGNRNLKGRNGKSALKMLNFITNKFDRENLNYWLEGGTLLGIIRENRLLPWDNDMDISIMVNEIDKLKKILKTIKKYRVKIKYFKRDSKEFRKGDIRIIKIKTYSCFGLFSDVVLDIFVKYQREDNIFWKVDTKVKSVPAKFYQELIKWHFNGKTFFIPKLYKEYLFYRYGEWQIIKKDWNTFQDDKALNGDPKGI